MTFLEYLRQVESSQGNVENLDATTSSGRAAGYYQITPGTWHDFAPKAGVDLGKYPGAMSAPFDVQERVAKLIPAGRYDPITLRKMRSAGFTIDPKATIGANALANMEASFGGGGGRAKTRGISLATPAEPAPTLTPDFSGPTSNPDAGLTSAAGFIHPTSNPDAAMVSAAGMSQPFKPKNPFSGVQPGLSAPMPPPVAPMAPPVPAPAAAGGMGGMGGLLSGLGSLASSLGGSSQSDPSANQLEPSSIDINRPSASAAAQMMAQLIEDRRKRYKMGTTLTSGGPNIGV